MAARPLLLVQGKARFSACGHYRWWLRRCWDPARPRLLFLGLNPSLADGRQDDPTLRRLQAFARAGGFGALEVLNLFARISPSPAVLRRAADPVGPACDRWIRARAAALALAPAGSALALGWGNGGLRRDRHRQVLALLEPLAPGVRRLCLGLTACGQPRHPLYLPATTPWQLWPGLDPGHGEWPGHRACQSGASAASCGHPFPPPPAVRWPARPAATTCT